MRAPLEANLIAAARWDASAQDLRRETVERVRRCAEAGEQLDPWLHAQLAIETTAEGADRSTAVEQARTVIAAAGDLPMVAASTVPEAALVLAFADLAEEARQATDAWLAQAQRLGWPLGVVMGSTCGALSALYRGAISEAIASARGGVTPGTEIRLAPIGVAFLIEALIERGETTAALSELAETAWTASCLQPGQPPRCCSLAGGCTPPSTSTRRRSRICSQRASAPRPGAYATPR